MATPSKPNTEQPQLLTCRQTAQILGLGERTVRRMTAERRIPFAKIGTSVRIRLADVEQFIASHEVEAMQ